MKEFKTNLFGNNYFCVDIETTGLEPDEEGAEILEIYIKIMRKGLKVKEYYMQYWSDNWEKTKDIHQIPVEELKGKPRFKDCPEDIALIKALFLRCLDPHDDMIFMAQYAPFEFKWFMHHLGFSDSDWDMKNHLRTCDTRLIAKHLYPDESHSLIPMCKKFDIAFPEGQHDFHRADQDVNAMWELYLHLKDVIEFDEFTEYDPETYKYDFDRPHDDSTLEEDLEEDIDKEDLTEMSETKEETIEGANSESQN